jgi:hypothetical protein
MEWLARAPFGTEVFANVPELSNRVGKEQVKGVKPR